MSKSFGNKLKEIRSRTGLSRDDFEETYGINKGDMSLAEQGYLSDEEYAALSEKLDDLTDT